MIEKFLPSSYYPIIKGDEIDFIAFYKLLMKGWKFIAFVAVSCAVLAAAYALSLPRLYLSKVSIYTIVSDTPQLSGLAGIASNFGLSLGGVDSPLDIGDIIASRSLKSELSKILWSTYTYDEDVNLTDYWEVAGGTQFSLNPVKWIKSFISNRDQLAPEQKDRVYLEETIEILDERISIATNINGLYTVKVWMEEPELAADVSNKIFELVANRLVRVSVAQAANKREFIEMRSVEVQAGLNRRENRVAEFLTRNNNYQASPNLTMVYNRLIRAVRTESQVYMTLMQEYELAKIEEVKNTPNIGVLDEGIPPSKKDKPRRKKMVILAFIFGSGAGLTTLFGRNYWRGAHQTLDQLD